MSPVFDEKDRAIRDARIAMWSGRTGPRVGDFVVMSEGDVRRFTHDWGDDIQVTSGIGGDGSFYFTRDGFMDYSGGLHPPILKTKLVDLNQTRMGHAWFFHHDERRAHSGVTCSVPCRVYRFVQE